ncbi:MAG: ATP-binding protein [Bifidobacteriaceae bacterium]|jgi:predicted AAA+ superfamily ATPase|nr:ATP-binding protein [Bifidobacteriaceae bacterium]
MTNIERNTYIDLLNKYKNTDLIKVITGVRRSGKSTILNTYAKSIKNHTIQINFESRKYANFLNKDWTEIYDYIIQKCNPKVNNYIFLDEVQNIKNFERLLDALYIEKYIDLYVTGSNAYMLSSELGTILTGRYVEIHVLPLSYFEFMNFIDKSKYSNLNFFADFVCNSAMPQSTILKSRSIDSSDYIKDLLLSIIEKDIFIRHTILSKNEFYKVADFIFDSVGSEISPTNIANTLTSNGTKIDKQTVSKYLQYLSESYVIYKVPRFDIKGKNLLKTLDKYYLVDTGFRMSKLGKLKNNDRGHLLENIVYLELLRRNKTVYVGKNNNFEVDFVVQTKEGDTKYYQVSWSVENEDTLKRELQSLQKIKDNFEKILLTTDFGSVTHEGINQINVMDWLCN